MATDADAYYPFASGAGQITTVAQWEDYMSDVLRDGVILGAGNEHAVFADSTGLQVRVPTGRVCIKGLRGVLTSQKTLGITANGASNSRIDRVVARLDSTNSKIVYDVLAGTPSASPVAPSLTQTSTTWEISLAQVTVPPGDSTIDAGQVTDERTFAFPRGVEVGDWHLTSRTTVAHSAEVFLQGQTVSRVTYAGLFGLWGTTYGAGDGVTTFKLPDMQGRFPAGRNSGDSTFSSVGAVGGEKNHVLTQAELPDANSDSENQDHHHLLALREFSIPVQVNEVSGTTITYYGLVGPGAGTVDALDTTGATNAHVHNIGGSNGGHNTLPPFLVVNYAIRAR